MQRPSEPPKPSPALPIVAAFSLAMASGCGESVYAGSEILWSARHETSDLSEWTLGDLGGQQIDGTDDAVEVTSEQARTGRFSVKLTRAGRGGGGPRLARLGGLPVEAYYSAWFFVPEPYTTHSYWTIFKFDAQASDQPVFDRGVDLQLRSVSSSSYVLEVLFHNEAYLRAPLPNPPPEVPIARWFQVEVEFRAVADATGRCVVWLDGRRVYELEARPTIALNSVGFMVSNLFSDVEPSPVALYVDDAVISRVRATPNGRLER